MDINTTRHLILIVLLLLGLSFTNKRETPLLSTTYKVTFGVKIGILPTGKLTEYSIIYMNNGKQVSSTPVDLNRLKNIGIGKWPIPPSNTTFHNFFKDFSLTDYALPDGTVVDYNEAFENLWKIRFSDHPFDQRKGKGWSLGDYRPSLKQQEYIYDRYGVRGYDQDYFIDTSFFQLLKDVLNPEWIEEYSSLE